MVILCSKMLMFEEYDDGCGTANISAHNRMLDVTTQLTRVHGLERRSNTPSEHRPAIVWHACNV